MPNPAAKKVIAVDLDEVLGQFADSFTRYCNDKWGTHLKPEDYNEHWAELWQVDHSETDRRAQEIYTSDVFRRMKRLEDAEAVLKQLAKNYKLVILTSRHRAVSQDTLDWIKKHFGSLFEEVHFAGIWDDMEKSFDERFRATKGELAKQIGADYLIDDNPKHCLAASEAGIKAILFGDYPWNQGDLPKEVVRTKNWQEVLEYFNGP